MANILHVADFNKLMAYKRSYSFIINTLANKPRSRGWVVYGHCFQYAKWFKSKREAELELKARN